MSALETTTIDFKKIYLEEKRKKKRASNKSNKTATQEESRTTTGIQEVKHENYPKLSFPSMTDGFLIDKYRLSYKDPKMYYISNFLSNDNHFLTWLQSFPGYTSPTNNNTYQDTISKWTHLPYAKRKVLLFDNNYSPIPNPLQQICNQLSTLFPKDKPPNHILINEYKTGLEGILPHTDGPNYHSQTATISIGGDVLFYFMPRLSTDDIGHDRGDSVADAEVMLEGNGSLLVFSEGLYDDYCHAIKDGLDVEYASHACCNREKGFVVKRGYRISLTFRHKYDWVIS